MIHRVTGLRQVEKTIRVTPVDTASKSEFFWLWKCPLLRTRIRQTKQAPVTTVTLRVFSYFLVSYSFTGLLLTTLWHRLSTLRTSELDPGHPTFLGFKTS